MGRDRGKKKAIENERGRGMERREREVENAQKEASGSPNIRAAHPQSAVV